MLLAEFIRRTGFTPEFADTLSSNWQEAAAMEALPECFDNVPNLVMGQVV